MPHGKFSVEYRLVRPDGEQRWIFDRAFPVRNAAGEIYRVAGVAQDITARKQAEEALRQSEAEIRQVADSMPQLVWVTRPDGYHEWYNSRWYEYTGTTPTESAGEGWNNFFHPDDQERAWEYGGTVLEPARSTKLSTDADGTTAFTGGFSVVHCRFATSQTGLCAGLAPAQTSRTRSKPKRNSGNSGTPLIRRSPTLRISPTSLTLKAGLLTSIALYSPSGRNRLKKLAGKTSSSWTTRRS